MGKLGARAGCLAGLGGVISVKGDGTGIDAGGLVGKVTIGTS